MVAKKSRAARVAGAVVSRAKEPSTYAGAAAIFEGLKLVFPAYGAALTAAQVIAGGIAVMQREGGRGGA